MGKCVQPKEVYYQCDICERKFYRKNKNQINTIKYKSFITYTKKYKLKTSFNRRELMLCDKCLEEMKDYIIQKVKER